MQAYNNFLHSYSDNHGMLAYNDNDNDDNNNNV